MPERTFRGEQGHGGHGLGRGQGVPVDASDDDARGCGRWLARHLAVLLLLLASPREWLGESMHEHGHAPLASTNAYMANIASCLMPSYLGPQVCGSLEVYLPSEGHVWLSLPYTKREGLLPFELPAAQLVTKKHK